MVSSATRVGVATALSVQGSPGSVVPATSSSWWLRGAVPRDVPPTRYSRAMRTAETVVRNPSGIHARPAAMFVRTAAGFKSSVTLENLDNPGLSGNAKSMIELMKVKAARDSRIRISAEGIDEDAAVEALVAFVDGGCGEKLEG